MRLPDVVRGLAAAALVLLCWIQGNPGDPSGHPTQQQGTVLAAEAPWHTPDNWGWE